MLTLPAARDVVRDDRPAYRPYAVEVRAVRRLSDRFTRVTFTGPELSWFGTDGLDQRVKVVFPLPGVALGPLAGAGADWYALWRELPDAQRHPLRTYTVRSVRPEEGELDLDFVVHDHDAGPTGPAGAGPAARWLRTAAPGDELVIVGPDARSVHSAVGIDWHPGAATDLLLAGDETAVPAICAVLEALPPGVRATALIEVEHPGDAVAVSSVADLDVRWIARSAGSGQAGSAHTGSPHTGSPHTGSGQVASLAGAVRDWAARHAALLDTARAPSPQDLDDIDVDTDLLWETPEGGTGGFYAWLAGESQLIKDLRRFLVTETGVDRSRVAFMGYWRRGRAERQ